jgi:hypothetical protein
LIALELGPRRQHPLRARAVAVGGRENECLGVGLHGGDERRPARIAVLAREHELRAGEDRLAAAEPLKGRRIAGARGPHELLCLLAELLQVHVDLPPSGPRPRLGRRRDRLVELRFVEVGSALPADRMRPRAPPQSSASPRT